MRILVSSVLGAIALANAAPALAVESIAHELTFTSASTLFDAGSAADGELSAAFGAYLLAPADDVLPGARTIAATAPDIVSADYRNLINAVSPVPEPRIWMGMIIGLGAIGYILRSRKRALPQAV